MPSPVLTDHPDRLRLEHAQGAVAARKVEIGGNELRRLLSARSIPNGA